MLVGGLLRGAVADYPFPPSLRQEHLAHARLLASREAYISSFGPGAVCAEVGVYRGDFSAHILTTNPSELHLIDIDLQQFQVERRFAGDARLHFRQGNSPDVLASYPPRFFDWIYIDAGHEYEAVRADALAAIPLLKPNGLLVFNDYIPWSYVECIPYGVVQTVNELCLHDGWMVDALCIAGHMYCDIGIRRPT